MQLGEQEIDLPSANGSRMLSKPIPRHYHALTEFNQHPLRVKSRLDVAVGEVLLSTARAMES